ncbi:MAG: ATP-binding cassette domain-containing protein [Ginsengibacter sp.]
MIKVERVTKYFGKTKAVDDISFAVAEAENVVLLGTSGCGKTTTLRMINRLTQASSGKIEVDGKNIKDLSPETLRRSIGYVLQHNGLFPHYTIAENIAIVPGLLKWPKDKIEKRTAELLEQLHLPQDYLTLYPDQLSGGQQQRVGLARALASDPPVLLMDEPFGALDAVTRSSITKEFSHLDVLKKKTILLVTHDVLEAFDMGDKILLMDKGKIVQAGSPADLLFRPANKFVSDFFASQQMQLELHTVLLKDIWANLLPENKSNDGGNIIDDDQSIWEALDILSNQQRKNIGVRNLVNNNTRYADYDTLFKALNALKQTANG